MIYDFALFSTVKACYRKQFQVGKHTDTVALEDQIICTLFGKFIIEAGFHH